MIPVVTDQAGHLSQVPGTTLYTTGNNSHLSQEQVQREEGFEREERKACAVDLASSETTLIFFSFTEQCVLVVCLFGWVVCLFEWTGLEMP